MLTPVAHTIQPQDETSLDIAPAKPKDKTVSPSASDFSQCMGQFLGVAVPNTLQTDENKATEAESGSVAERSKPQAAAQPAGQFLLQPAAPQVVTRSEIQGAAQPANPTVLQPASRVDAQPETQDTTPPAHQPAPQIAAAPVSEKTNPFLGVNSPAAVAVNITETAGPDKTTADPQDQAVPLQENGSENTLRGAVHDKAETKSPVSVETLPSDNKAGDLTKQKKPDLHELLGKQQPSGTADESKTGDVADAGLNDTRPTVGEFHTVLHQETSGVQNAQAQISGAAVTHRSPAGNETVRFHAVNAADVLDAAPTIVKDGNRLAVKFEQEGLGKLDIDLRLDKGVINAQIQVADNTTKTLIENNMQQIVDSLLKAGLSVGGFSVSLKGGGQQQGTFQEHDGYGTERPAAAVSTGVIAQRSTATGQISIFI